MMVSRSVGERTPRDGLRAGNPQTNEAMGFAGIMPSGGAQVAGAFQPAGSTMTSPIMPVDSCGLQK